MANWTREFAPPDICCRSLTLLDFMKYPDMRRCSVRFGP